MTFTLLRAGFPNSAVAIALAIVPLVALALAPAQPPPPMPDQSKPMMVAGGHTIVSGTAAPD